MIIFLILLLSIIAVAFAIQPLFSKVSEPFDLKNKRMKDMEALLSKKNKLYSDIKDLDFEFGIGKMAENDYRSLRGECIREVALVLEHMEHLQNSKDNNGKISDKDLEELIRLKRRLAISETKSCTLCGHVNPLEAKFCSECGSKLS